MSPLSLSLRQRRVFVDTSAYLALLDRADSYHTEALAILQWLANRRFRQFTTNTLISETHALLLSSLGSARARKFLQDIAESNTVIVRTSFRDEEHAKSILFKYTDKDFSLADAISFAVMERLQISSAFTFDHHFAQYGFAMLTPDAGSTTFNRGALF